MTDAPIVSHVANQNYRDHVDAMACAEPGCKRWRYDGQTKFCERHGGRLTRYRVVLSLDEPGDLRIVKGEES